MPGTEIEKTQINIILFLPSGVRNEIYNPCFLNTKASMQTY